MKSATNTKQMGGLGSIPAASTIYIQQVMHDFLLHGALAVFAGV
jgi:hypothetical protein